MKRLESVQWNQVNELWKDLPNYPDGVVQDIAPDTQWFDAEAELQDIADIHLLSATDLKDAFGSFHLSKVHRSNPHPDQYDDRYHWDRINDIRRRINGYETIPRVILIHDSMQRKYILADGNHRAIAYFLEGKIASMKCFVGTSPYAFSTFTWADRAIGDY